MVKKIIYSIAVIALLGCNQSDNYKELPYNYGYRSESQEMTSIEKLTSKKIEIPFTVVNYNNNDSIILATQIENPFVYEMVNKGSSKKELIFPHKINFWIINMLKDSIYGPMDLNSYLCKRIELNIPTDLKLKLEI